MPSISEAIQAAKQMNTQSEKPQVSPSSPSQNPGLPSVSTNNNPGRNSMLRCPMPPLWKESTDSQRQFYMNGQVPQMRVMSPNTDNVSGGSSGGNVEISNNQGGSGGSGGGGGGTTPTGVAAVQSTVTTPELPPNTTFTGQLAASKSFQLLSIAVGSPCRIQFYGTLAAQLQDAARALDVPPPAGTAQNIIADVVLDTSPYQWSFQDRVGANADAPQKPVMYVTITNLDATSDVVTLTLQYVPIESL